MKKALLSSLLIATFLIFVTNVNAAPNKAVKANKANTTVMMPESNLQAPGITLQNITSTYAINIKAEQPAEKAYEANFTNFNFAKDDASPGQEVVKNMPNAYNTNNSSASTNAVINKKKKDAGKENMMNANANYDPAAVQNKQPEVVARK